jgi:mono/diheme cytochrome c family protein
MQSRRTGALILLVAVAVILGSCAQEDYPSSLWDQQHPPPDYGHICMPARAEALPARLVAMSGGTGAGGVVLVSDIFSRFGAVCGSCHGPAVDPPGQGCFQIQSSTDFTTKMTEAALAHVTSSVCPNPGAGTSATCPAMPDQANPGDPMPPCSSPNGETYTQRTSEDPVRQFAELVQEWIAAGKPAQFTPGGSKGSSSSGSSSGAGGDGGAPASSSANPYTMTPEAGNGMTNIGNCIPGNLTIGLEDAVARGLDAKFAAMQAKQSGTAAELIGLPEHLSETDLFTLDSAVLARYGVLAYAPNYPLWSDNAGKLRHVRPPRGQPITFDKTTQQFHLPPNTRFYKTFMKLIADTDGSYRYRKIETRLIVARPDTNNADGTAAAQNALFGTYQWNADETDATLVETPLNDGKPFADTMFLYNTDEELAAEILASNPPAPDSLLLQYQAARHYAIPSSQRCIQCHMGSPSEAFVLGFTPLQINRRPTGIGGTIEAVGHDELTQLQRFIDAGIIAGIDSPADILPLEQSQSSGGRLPRNEHELVAQGYMLGNCVHCHNPRGYPTVTNAPLLNNFNFLPSATGGIFQFPLESYSPRIYRGLTGTTQIPYITPSLVDQPRYSPDTLGQAADVFLRSNGGAAPFWAAYAPWRSIIYRNVDAAFAYSDDIALFPHMPFNTPGFDTRAKQILAEWMVSIPAVRKRPDVPEYAFRTDALASDNIGGLVVDESNQPYVEVAPGAAGYSTAVAAANQRLTILHTGINPAVPLDPTGTPYSRFADPGQTDDIVDPAVVIDPICHPTPAAPGGTYPYPFPNHPHWVITDLTDPAGAWQPRQSNWPTVLVKQVIPPENKGCMPPASQDAAYADQVRAVGLLQNAALSDLHDFATNPVPLGLWQAPQGCDLSSERTVSSLTGADRPHWMDVVPNLDPNAAVYFQQPGATVFKMICINCHGPRADSNGRLAQNLATMSGGLAQVADFRDGLFGPVTAPDSDIQRVYGQSPPVGEFPADAPSNWQSVMPDDRAARYMAWMGLGGTAVNIPISILQIVSQTKVLNQQRHVPATELSANMLSQAKALCLGIVGPSYDGNTAKLMPLAGGYMSAETTGLNSRLIYANGDAELWMRMCNIANPSPIHVATLDPSGSTDYLSITEIYGANGLAIDGASGVAPGSLVPASVYPTDCQPGDSSCAVGDETGAVKPSLVACDDTNVNLPPSDPHACNKWPWCVDVTKVKPSGAQAGWLAGPNAPPVCPSAVVTFSHGCQPPAVPPATCFGNEAANTWAVRGAVSAGMSVFLYLRQLELLPKPPTDYNQCPN